MISVEFTVKSGSVYVADVINKHIKRTKGQETNRIQEDWTPYEELFGGYEGTQLEVYWGVGKDEFSTKARQEGFKDGSDDEARKRYTVTSTVVGIKYLKT